jgi:hypothetical protein
VKVSAEKIENARGDNGPSQPRNKSAINKYEAGSDTRYMINSPGSRLQVEIMLQRCPSDGAYRSNVAFEEPFKRSPTGAILDDCSSQLISCLETRNYNWSEAADATKEAYLEALTALDEPVAAFVAACEEMRSKRDREGTMRRFNEATDQMGRKGNRVAGPRISGHFGAPSSGLKQRMESKAATTGDPFILDNCRLLSVHIANLISKVHPESTYLTARPRML